MEPVIGFNKQDASRIIEMIDGGGASNIGQTLSTALDDNGCVLAFTTSTGSARSGTTFGSGTAERRLLSTSGVASAVSPTQTYTYRNAATSTIANGKYIILMRMGISWLCIWEEC